MGPSSPSPDGHDAPALPDWELVRHAAGNRSLRIALASELGYLQEPVLSQGTVCAVLGAGAGAVSIPESETFRVALRSSRGRGALAGDCSRCSQVFGPCLHVTILGVDLARSLPLREALLRGERTGEAAAAAPQLRAVLRAELDFDRSFAAWLSPAVEAAPVEIAASPVAANDSDFGHAYGDHPSDARHGPALSFAVRRVGERKLLSAREITPPVRFGARDRRVLEHTRDRGSGRKAAYAIGVEAALAIDAMRLHAGVFVQGYKTLLDFRSQAVRPALVLGAPTKASLSGAPLDALSAFWTTDGGDTRIAFADSFFFFGPTSYVWTTKGAIYRVAPDVDPDFVRPLASAPVLLIPRDKLQAVGARLLRATRGRGIALPGHQAFGLPPVETPRIVLRLAGEPLDVTGNLAAVYRTREVPLLGALFSRSADEDGRDLESEERARTHVARAGLVTRGADEDGLPPREGIAISGEFAITFWRTGLLALRAAVDPAIDVELSERLTRIRVGAPLSARVHVTLEGDWLRTRLEFACDELAVELSAIRAALSRKQRYVALSDGTLARISASVEALADESSAVMKGAAEARLPAHQLGRLDRWIEDNDGRLDAGVEELRRRLRALAVAADPEMPRGLRATLRPYQRAGLAWLQFLQALGAGGVLADDMGLGKTIMTLAFLLRRKQKEGPAPNLVVCPTSVATNWLREAARFTPGLRMRLLHGLAPDARSAAAIAGCDVAVTTYALLRRDLDMLSAVRFRCVVLDEAQNIKNAEAATTRAANRLDATMRLCLSGTPIENRLRELWSLSSFVNPGILGSLRAFEGRFERPIAADRASPLVAELRAIVRPFLLRRTKDEVLRDLPPKIEVDRIVTLEDADRRMYDALAHALRSAVARDIEKRGLAQSSLSVFTALTRLRQMACDPRLFDTSLAANGGSRPSAKRSAFLDLVREIVAEGRRALVFSQFVQLLTLWRRDLDAEGIAYEYLDGSTLKRDEVVARFQGGSAPLFLISLKAGGAGLNLTAADTVIHCDPWWNPAVEQQATDRAHRIGQNKTVTVVRLIARGTIEEKILSLKAKKRELTSAVVSDGARALEGLTEDDLRTLLGDAADDGGAADGGLSSAHL